MRLKSVFAASAVFFALATAPASQAADQTLGMAIMSAVVDKSGDLYSGAGAVSSAFVSGPNWYTVKFNRPLAGCASVATANSSDVTIGSRTDQAGDTVFIEIRGPSGVLGQQHFQLIVFCGQ
jgi:hypothetical protein